MYKELASRLRKQTNRQINDCLKLLRNMPASEAEAYVEEYERNPRDWFIDPIELSSKYLKVIDAVESKVDQFLKIWEAEQLRGNGPEIKLLMVKRSKSIVASTKKKELLLEIGIDWKSKAEMNQDISLD